MNLQEFFAENPAGALAFSGGTDSALLVWAAARWGKNWRAYYVHSAFQPAFELADARRIAGQCGMPLTVIQGDVLSNPTVTANPPDRCYHCKRNLFGTLAARALADGYTLLLDGTNASDAAGDRPGMRALRELSEGDRLIGIISHVSELRREIDRQIVVTRSPDGASRAKIETDLRE